MLHLVFSLSWQHKYQHSRADLSMVYCKQTLRDWQLIGIFSLMNKNIQLSYNLLFLSSGLSTLLGLGFRVLFHGFNFGLPWSLNYLWPLELLIEVNKCNQNIANKLYLFPRLTSQSQGDSKTCSWTKWIIVVPVIKQKHVITSRIFIKQATTVPPESKQPQ